MTRASGVFKVEANAAIASESAAIWPRTASAKAAVPRDARKARINNAAANGSSGIHQKFAAAQEITLVLFLLFPFQTRNAFDRLVIDWRKLQAFSQPLDPFFARLAVQSVAGFVKLNLLRLREPLEITARHFLRNAFVLAAELQKDRGRRAAAKVMDRIVERVFLEKIAERVLADALAKLDHLAPRGIEDVLLVGEDAGH